jgi:F-type H+-transporting ATPase subunit c
MLEGAKSIGAGAATIASAGAAVGIGNVFSSLINSVARNPSLAKQLFGYAILGFALTEAIALFALMMAFLISFVFRTWNVVFFRIVVSSSANFPDRCVPQLICDLIHWSHLCGSFESHLLFSMMLMPECRTI